nr:hypothetical protein [Candidatus Sigynarchaeum springense]
MVALTMGIVFPDAIVRAGMVNVPNASPFHETSKARFARAMFTDDGFVNWMPASTVTDVEFDSNNAMEHLGRLAGRGDDRAGRGDDVVVPRDVGPRGAPRRRA